MEISMKKVSKQAARWTKAAKAPNKRRKRGKKNFLGGTGPL